MIINFMTGVMGAGKSEQLIEDVAYYQSNGNNVARVRVSLKRESEYGRISSRNGKSTFSLVINVEQNEVETLASLSKYIYDCGNVDYLLIDESQFLSPEQVNAIELAAQIFNLKAIVFYGLVSDFTGRTFDGSAHIMEIADNVNVIPAECENENCDRDATHNGRFVDGKLVTTGKKLLEDKGLYKALCALCYKSLQ